MLYSSESVRMKIYEKHTHPADPAGVLPPPHHMLPHLLTLTRAAVPGLTLIHPDSHLLGKKVHRRKKNAPRSRRVNLHTFTRSSSLPAQRSADMDTHLSQILFVLNLRLDLSLCLLFRLTFLTAIYRCGHIRTYQMHRHN